MKYYETYQRKEHIQNLCTLDYQNNEIYYFKYNNKNSYFGWGIDRIIPQALSEIEPKTL